MWMREGYITIEGESNISNKIHNLLDETEERVYLSCSYLYLSEFQEELMKLEQQGKKVVIITDGVCSIGKCTSIYRVIQRENRLELLQIPNMC